ncbi:ATP-dependent DNA helicase 2 subunit 1 [Pseudolycoriella hygida]|uniref:ATP-dependent DNA helicase 2 subunit 1 n=1 Tax=Pseudolycoriella hygida TaxID=35572 RepID=A0A9Q0RWY8_9DIPT|nr:ATP-dependent DNA helicase 2 subunit 1 [Pseudolycoriella hygida]
MSSFWNPDEADQDIEEEFGSFSVGRDGVLFLVDAATITNDDDQFRNCLSLIETTMMNRIIRSDKDLIGVVFYNTQFSPAPQAEQTDIEAMVVAPKNTAIFMHLSTMSKDTISYMKHFRDSDDFFDFKNRYGSVTSESFVEVLWLCSRIFMRCGYKLKQSNIILFTNNDQPYPDPSSELDKCLIRGKDLRDLGVHIMLVPMVDDGFDVNKFFREFICNVNDLDAETYEFKSPSEQRDELSSRAFHQDYRSSCLRYFHLTIGNGLAVGCGLYAFAKDFKEPKRVHLLSSTNEIVVSRRSIMAGRLDEETMETQFDKRLLPGEQRKVQEVGGQRIIFTPDELTKVKAMVEPGMRLLGFKPMSQLPPYCAMKSCRFVFPSEKSIKGSTKLFRALWEKCIEKDKFAMCVFAQIRKVAPRYVALVPQQRESMGSDGFRVLYLPMQTDIRTLDIFQSQVPELTAAEIDTMKKMIKKLKFTYKLDTFENPSQRTFFANLEALVFEQKEEMTEDNTLPDTNLQDSQIQSLVDELTEIFGRDAAVATKRPYSAKGGDPSAKVQKVSIGRDEIISAITSNNISRVTVAQLREFLTSEGLTGVTKLTKPGLIEMIQKLFHSISVQKCKTSLHRVIKNDALTITVTLLFANGTNNPNIKVPNIGAPSKPNANIVACITFPMNPDTIAAKMQRIPEITDITLSNLKACRSVSFGQTYGLITSSYTTAVREFIPDETVDNEAENIPATNIPGIPGIEPIVSMTKSGNN